jgi:hypothetical protein
MQYSCNDTETVAETQNCNNFVSTSFQVVVIIAGAGLLGLGIFGVAGGIFSRSYASLLQLFFGSPQQQESYQDVSEADKSLYELNFVRQSLRRGRKE